MSWIYELKKGDEVLDQSRTWIGTVIANDGDKLFWEWNHLYDNKVKYDLTVVSMKLEKLDAQDTCWILVTPLTEELL